MQETPSVISPLGFAVFLLLTVLGSLISIRTGQQLWFMGIVGMLSIASQRQFVQKHGRPFTVGESAKMIGIHFGVALVGLSILLVGFDAGVVAVFGLMLLLLISWFDSVWMGRRYAGSAKKSQESPSVDHKQPDE